MSSYQCRDSHHGDRTVSRPSYFYNGSTHTLKDRLYVEVGIRGLFYLYKLAKQALHPEYENMIITTQTLGVVIAVHDDVIKWKHFPRYLPFVRGICRSPVEFPTHRPVTRNFDIFFDLRPNKRLSKQW